MRPVSAGGESLVRRAGGVVWILQTEKRFGCSSIIRSNGTCRGSNAERHAEKHGYAGHQSQDAPFLVGHKALLRIVGQGTHVNPHLPVSVAACAAPGRLPSFDTTTLDA